MFLCYYLRRTWRSLKNIIYGYEKETYTCRKPYSKDPWETCPKQERSRRHGDSQDNYREVFEEYKVYSENCGNFCIPKRQIYETYGIKFESREERDTFASKMKGMEMILEKELNEILQQHIRLQEERTKLARFNAQIKADSSNRNDFSRESSCDVSMFCRIDDNPLLEEVSLVNEIQDVLDLMCELSRELKDIAKVLNIEVRERTLHPEPRLIQIKAPEDELSEQMKNDGGFKYSSSDNTVQRISYDTLPPPLILIDFLEKQSETYNDKIS